MKMKKKKIVCSKFYLWYFYGELFCFTVKNKLDSIM